MNRNIPDPNKNRINAQSPAKNNRAVSRSRQIPPSGANNTNNRARRAEDTQHKSSSAPQTRPLQNRPIPRHANNDSVKSSVKSTSTSNNTAQHKNSQERRVNANGTDRPQAQHVSNPPTTTQIRKDQAPRKKERSKIAGKLITKLTSAPANTAKKQKNDFIKPTDVVRIKGSYDKLFLILVIILTLFGIIMDFSASYAYAYNSYGDSFHFVKNQIIFACIGMVALIAAMQFDYRWMRTLTIPAFLGAVALLVGVLMYGVASGVAQRWITLGPITFQPSEIMKLALVLMLALYVARNQDRITNYRNFKQSTTYGMIIPFLIVGVACLLVMLEKHFSGTIIIFAIGMIVIFAAGARRDLFILGVAGAAVVILIAITFVPYARERIDMLLNPENYDPTGKIWQTLQGLYAIGSGGLFGVGLGNSRQKHMYVSQPHNDFIFSIIAEELGFAGATLVIILFMLLIWRGFVIALKAPDTFSTLVVIGLISKVAIQALLNIAVVTNTIPNTGISLPFFSYGGTALMLQLGEMGIILSISRYSYQRKEDLE